jgi:hypothetical protein
MADSAFLKGVMELYQGEVMGEVIFYELLRTAEDDNQRYKLATILQLKSETKARLSLGFSVIGSTFLKTPQSARRDCRWQRTSGR